MNQIPTIRLHTQPHKAYKIMSSADKSTRCHAMNDSLPTYSPPHLKKKEKSFVVVPSTSTSLTSCQFHGWTSQQTLLDRTTTHPLMTGTIICSSGMWDIFR